MVYGCFNGGLSSKGVSVDDGKVEEELNRAEADELSWPPLDAELFVPPLPLFMVSISPLESSNG